MKEPRVSDFKLEQLSLGELSPAEEKHLKDNLRHDGGLRRRFEVLSSSDQSIKNALPAERVVPEVKRRLQLVSANQRRGLWPQGAQEMGWAFAVIAVCIALTVVLWERPVEEQGAGYRVKGPPSLTIHKVTGARTLNLSGQDLARAGDLLQLSVLGATDHWVVVFSLDGAREVTLHYPLSEAEKTMMGSPRFSLPRSYELDAAPDFERFFLITSQTPIDVEAVLSLARQFALETSAEDLSMQIVGGLPPHLRQSSCLLKKVTR